MKTKTIRPRIDAADYRHLLAPAPVSPIRTGNTAQASPQPASRTASAPQPAQETKENSR